MIAIKNDSHIVRRMYICLCNALKEKTVRSAIEGGACSVSDAFRRLGCQPQCGKCVPMIREELQVQGIGSAGLYS